MELPPIISEYFAAWNRHDATEIVACFTETGLYHDPYVPNGVGGNALAQYTQGVFDGIADLRFDIVATYLSDNGVVIAEWLMVASPVVRVPGVDIFMVDGDKISNVQGYYDRKTFESQRKSF